jgi:hypothetical protein
MWVWRIVGRARFFQASKVVQNHVYVGIGCAIFFPQQ